MLWWRIYCGWQGGRTRNHSWCDGVSKLLWDVSQPLEGRARAPDAGRTHTQGTYCIERAQPTTRTSPLINGLADQYNRTVLSCFIGLQSLRSCSCGGGGADELKSAIYLINWLQGKLFQQLRVYVKPAAWKFQLNRYSH